jgi:hypothetical protein
MANVSLENKITLDNSAGGAGRRFVINELNVQGLPSLLFWVRLNSPVPNILWNPLFSVTNVTLGGATAPNWHEFTNGFILVPGNVTTFTIRAAVGIVGMAFTVPAGTSIDVDTVTTAGG